MAAAGFKPSLETIASAHIEERRANDLSHATTTESFSVPYYSVKNMSCVQ